MSDRNGGVAEALAIEYSYPDDGVTVVSLVGECDLASAPGVGRALSYVIEDDPDLLVVDLSATTFLDSTGLRTIYIADRKRRIKRRDGIVLVTNEVTQRLLELSGMEAGLRLVSGVDVAVTGGGRWNEPKAHPRLTISWRSAR